MFKMLRNWYRYLIGSSALKANSLKDPTVEIELELERLTRKNHELREAGAKVIAGRTTLTGRYNAAVKEEADLKVRAIAALERADKAKAGGDESELAKWSEAAQRYNSKRTSKASLASGLKAQLGAMEDRVALIKEQAAANEARLDQLRDDRHVILSKLEEAKAKEMINETMESMNKASGIFDDANFAKIEEKVDARLALADAKAELESGSMAATTRELEKGLKAEDDALALDGLRAELGLIEAPKMAELPETTEVPVTENA